MTTGESQKHLPENKQPPQGKKSAFRIGLWTGILFTLIAIISTISTIQTGLYAFGGIALTIVIATAGFAAAYLARGGKEQAGGALLVGTILVMSTTLPIVAKGQGIPLAILTVIVISSIAYYTLPGQWTARATTASILIGLVIILADFFLPDFGIVNDPRVTYVVSAIAGAIYFIVLLRRFGNFSLRAKLVASFLFIILLPILALSVYNNLVMRNILTRQAESSLKTLAAETTQNIDQFIASQLDIIKMEAQQPVIAEFMQQSQFVRDEKIASTALKTLLTFVRKNPVFIQSYALLDMSGKVVLSTDVSQLGQNESQTEHFRLAILQQKPQISNVNVSPGYSVFYLISPIRAENGNLVGMLRAEYNAVILQYLVSTRTIESGRGQRVVLAENTSLVRLADTQERQQLYERFPEIANQTEKLTSQTVFLLPGAGAGQGIFAVSQPLTGRPWVVVAQQPESTIYAQADEQARALVLVSIGLTLFALVVALLTSQVISRPLASLSQIARRITSGDLSARANIGTDDEVGQLARVFNEMTIQLNQTLSGLEQRIEERTAELQIANQQSDQRARQLQSIADVSKVITREQNIEKLLPLITDVVSERFGYYHVGIFLLDAARRAAILQASNSPGGQRMIANGHRLTLGTGSIVGYTALTGKPRIALDVGEDAVFFNNPNLPETHSEMALPLVVRGTVIGVIDMQSKQAGAFKQEDIDILSILADQIAIAIENARLFQQTQLALDESRSVAQTFLRQEWSALARRQSTVGYLYSGMSGKPLSTPAQADEIEQVIQRGAVIKKESKPDQETNPTLAIPIALGDQVIGAIRVQSPDRTRAWSNEEINLLRSIAERVGLALDNARLVASSQKRAAKERAIGEISAKISAAADMDAILKTAVQEIGVALSSADVVIQLKQFEEE